MNYRDISACGVIGDLQTVALVSRDGIIDWCCLPAFDSPSVFAAILDEHKGGYFRLSVKARARRRQMYLPETNILVSRFLAEDGVGEVTDFMPIASGAEQHRIVRIAKSVRGSVRFRMECHPAFDYARAGHELTVDGCTARFRAGDCVLGLGAPVDLAREGQGISAEFTLEEGCCATFLLQYGGELPADSTRAGEEALRQTIAFWKGWVAHCTYRGRWREMVMRSALTLKLLTYAPTGAIVAAPTCSLPEVIGGVRNWDYRYTWIRDAAFTIYALLRLGYRGEADKFMEWLQHRAREPEHDGPLQVMYGIDGRHELPEIDLDHLEGYRGSRPVRIGNRASKQLQLDIYGELIDSIYLYNKHAREIPWDLWVYVRQMLDWVGDNWQREDQGVWESRGGPHQFVYSKMQCWVALDRGLRIARKRGLPLDIAAVEQKSGCIYETIMRDGWNERLHAFVQYFGSDALDATALLLPLMMFISPTDPRMVSTLDAIMKGLVSDSLVYRYIPGKAAGDGLPGREGTFSICTFWLVQTLARAGRLDDARLIFEKMLTYANHLGLYAEEVGPEGQALGNFPQAFTHLGLIGAAYELDRALDSRGVW